MRIRPHFPLYSWTFPSYGEEAYSVAVLFDGDNRPLFQVLSRFPQDTLQALDHVHTTGVMQPKNHRLRADDEETRGIRLPPDAVRGMETWIWSPLPINHETRAVRCCIRSSLTTWKPFWPPSTLILWPKGCPRTSERSSTPICNVASWRMAQLAAPLVEQGIPWVPTRQ
jgi:hypothetical protein